jgi:hypothetical protein
VAKFDLTGMLLFSGLSTFNHCYRAWFRKSNQWLVAHFGISCRYTFNEFILPPFQRVDNPLIDLNLIKIRTLRIGVFGNLLTRLGIGGMPLL